MGGERTQSKPGPEDAQKHSNVANHASVRSLDISKCQDDKNDSDKKHSNVTVVHGFPQVVSETKCDDLELTRSETQKNPKVANRNLHKQQANKARIDNSEPKLVAIRDRSPSDTCNDRVENNHSHLEL